MSIHALQDVDAEDDFQDLGQPIGDENDDETNNSVGDAGFAGLGFFRVGGGGEHGEAAGNKHAKEDETGDGEEVGQKGVGNICWGGKFIMKRIDKREGR